MAIVPSKFYLAKSPLIVGTNYREIYKSARSIFKTIKAKSKRKPYIRAAYFNKQKIFFDYFWIHIAQKKWSDKMRRLRFFPAALELLTYCRNQPEIMSGVKKSEKQYRFYGIVRTGEKFAVQVKQTAQDALQCISIFPLK